MNVKPIPPHGTRSRYYHRTVPCRCDECREAVRLYQSVHRADERASGFRYNRGRRVWRGVPKVES